MVLHDEPYKENELAPQKPITVGLHRSPDLSMHIYINLARLRSEACSFCSYNSIWKAQVSLPGISVICYITS